MVLPLAKQLLGGAITFFILLILIFFLVNKFWVTESDYLPEDSWEIFAAMDFNDSLIKKDILICSRISGATMVEESIYRVNSEMITVAYNNNSSEEIPYNLKYIIRSLLKEELNFSVYHNDSLIYSGRLPSSHDQTRHYHNYNANNFILNLPIRFYKGKNLIRVDFDPQVEQYGPLTKKLRFYDFTLNAKKEFYQAIEKNFIIGDEGDVREALNLIRNLRTNLYLSEYMPGQNQKKENAAKIVSFINLPIFYYVAMLFSIPAGDSVMAFNLLFIIFVSIALVVCFSFIAGNRSSKEDRLFIYVILVIVSLNSVLLINRWGMESLYSEPLLGLFYLIFLRTLMERDVVLTISYGMFVSLTKSYGFILVIPALLYFIIFAQNRQFFARCLRIFLGMLLAVLLIYLAVIWKFNLTRIFISESALEYKHRFALMRLLFTHGGYAVMIIFRKIASLFLLCLWSGCFVGMGSFFNNHKKRGFFLIIPFVYIIFLSFLNGFRIHYLYPVIFLPVIFGISYIISIEKLKTKRLNMIFVFFIALGCLLASKEVTADYTGNQDNKIIVYSQTIYDKVGYFFRNKDKRKKADTIFIEEREGIRDEVEG